MSPQFPKLQKNLDEIEARLNEVLKSEFVDTDLIEDLELTVTEYSFSERSSQTDVIASLRELLLSIPTMETKGKKTNDRSKNELDTSQIQRKHILAAQSLLKVQKCQDLAIKVLLAGLKKDDSNDHETVSEMAAKALGELNFMAHESSYDLLAHTCQRTKDGRWYNTSNAEYYARESDCKSNLPQ